MMQVQSFLPFCVEVKHVVTLSCAQVSVRLTRLPSSHIFLGLSTSPSLDSHHCLGHEGMFSWALRLYDGHKLAYDFGVSGSTPYDTQGEAKWGDVYTLSLDTERGELSFLRNGRDLGVAF